MAADFDHTAHNYDQDFTSSPIGKVQRDLVFKSLESCFLISNQTKVLEINCGTGEDALHFGELGANVLATDISEKMVNVARQKTADLDNVSCQVLDINALAEFEPDKKFDLIFSNFGGLNCLSETELLSFFKNATQKLEKDGVLALVIMPNFCLWETF
jgi:ubiquinone/menaquinone biosynthesis C-methylase UbiE